MKRLIPTIFLCCAGLVSFAQNSITRGPYLQKGSGTEATLRWRTLLPASSLIKVGTQRNAMSRSAGSILTVTDHIVRIDSLRPDTKYYYTVGSSATDQQGDSLNYFVTAPSDTTTRKVRIAVLGDCGRNVLNVQTATISAYQNYLRQQGVSSGDLLLLNGDNAYVSGLDAEYTTGFFNAYQGNLLKNHILFPAPGNHDYNNNPVQQQTHVCSYYDNFTLPSEGESGGLPSHSNAFYSYDWGNVHFLSLDSYGLEDSGSTRLYDTAGTQVRWIKQDLDRNRSKWTIAYWHHPPFTMGSHNSDTEDELVKIRENFIKILERYGVDLIVCGHSHDYERSYLLSGYTGKEPAFDVAQYAKDSSSARYDGSRNSCPYTYRSGRYDHGTVYTVMGCSGAVDGIQSGYPHDAMPFSKQAGGLLSIEVEQNRMDVRFIMTDSTLGDRFTTVKDHTPTDTVEIVPGNPVRLSADWIGNYQWTNGASTKETVFVPAGDTLVGVTDHESCLNKRFYLRRNGSAAVPAVALQPGIRLYPNPNRNLFTIESDLDGNHRLDLTLTDLSGRTVYRETLRFQGTRTEIRTQLTPGLYLAELVLDGTRSTAKLQVVK